MPSGTQSRISGHRKLRMSTYWFQFGTRDFSSWLGNREGCAEAYAGTRTSKPEIDTARTEKNRFRMETN
jgi:hypothetical protein